MAPDVTATIKTAILDYIALAEYVVGPMPALKEAIWTKLRLSAIEWRSMESGKVHPRKTYKMIGKAQLRHHIFLLGQDELADKPEGYESEWQTVDTILGSQDILRALLKKLDESLVEKNVKVDAGFHALVGAIWIEEYRQDSSAADNSYLLHLAPPATSASNRPERPTATIRLLTQLRKLQGPPPVTPSLAASTIRPDPPDSPFAGILRSKTSQAANWVDGRFFQDDDCLRVLVDLKGLLEESTAYWARFPLLATDVPEPSDEKIESEVEASLSIHL
ncbi:hypothetical protein FB451DRAFT_1179715 [Mycena latifolia]|nr:hypothetical protein FB451DRAFT_1179715 [Mycena latifolia]